ncbi:MAG: hypothetical protein ACYC0T_07330 [Ramlibacter sp.]
MNRHFVFALVLAAAATTAFADDITIDTTPFVSTRTRAEVQAQLQQRGPNVWSTQYNPLAQFSAQRSRAEAVAEYLASRRWPCAFPSASSSSRTARRSCSAGSAATASKALASGWGPSASPRVT